MDQLLDFILQYSYFHVPSLCATVVTNSVTHEIEVDRMLECFFGRHFPDDALSVDVRSGGIDFVFDSIADFISRIVVISHFIASSMFGNQLGLLIPQRTISL
jgi:hypothetical protein